MSLSVDVQSELYGKRYMVVEGKNTVRVYLYMEASTKEERKNIYLNW